MEVRSITLRRSGYDVLVLTLAVAAIAMQIPADFRTSGFAASVQAWTFNKFSAYEAIEKTAQAGGKLIEFFPGQKLTNEHPELKMGPEMPESDIIALQAKLQHHGVKAVAFGVTGISTKEPEARKLFTWARRMGIGIINTESTEAIDTIEKMVKEFDIRVGFHNHPKQPNNPNYKVWDPQYVYDLVKDRDTRIGACADTGHWVRSGIKPVDAIRTLKGRIVSSHLKDLNEFSPTAHDNIFGTGVSDIAAILAEYRKIDMQGSISVEYEYNWDHNVPDVAACLGFIRGYGAR